MGMKRRSTYGDESIVIWLFLNSSVETGKAGLVDIKVPTEDRKYHPSSRHSELEATAGEALLLCCCEGCEEEENECWQCEPHCCGGVTGCSLEMADQEVCTTASGPLIPPENISDICSSSRNFRTTSRPSSAGTRAAQRGSLCAVIRGGTAALLTPIGRIQDFTACKTQWAVHWRLFSSVAGCVYEGLLANVYLLLADDACMGPYIGTGSAGSPGVM